MSARRFDPIAIAVVLTAMALLPTWGRHLVPPAEPRDFYVDWMAARDLVAGRPLYRPLDEEVPSIGVPGKFIARYTTHPPPSALVALPLAHLDYRTAFLCWNVIGLALLAHALWLMGRELGWTVTPRTFGIGAVALMAWFPLWENVKHGQSGLVLLWLLVQGWRALRRGRDVGAGVAIGLAAALKIYPGLLLPYLMIGRRWRAVGVALATMLGVVGLTIVMAGPAAWPDWFEYGVPELRRWWPNWGNASIVGFTTRLLLPDATCRPLVTSAMLAALVIVSASAAVLLVVAWRCRADPNDVDRGFAMTVTAAVLLSAVAWQHYFVLLLLPLAVTLPRALRLGGGWLIAFVAGWVLMDVPQRELAVTILGDAPAAPVASLTFVSIAFYGLVTFFAWQALAWSVASGTPTTSARR